MNFYHVQPTVTTLTKLIESLGEYLGLHGYGNTGVNFNIHHKQAIQFHILQWIVSVLSLPMILTTSSI
jgi:hypothetical protein